MKNILLFSVFLFLLGHNSSAQQAAVAVPTEVADATKAAAQAATDQLAAKYSLSADQAKKMYAVQLRKLGNIAEVAPLRQTDPAKFLAKSNAIQTGTLGSIQRILNSKEQLAIFQRTQSEVRVLKAAKRKELLTQKVATLEIDTALLDIYQE